MDNIVTIFSALWGITFWSTVLAFIPTTLYLLVTNPPIYEAQAVQAQGIYIINDSSVLQKGRRSQIRGVACIYAFCFLCGLSVYVFNWMATGQLRAAPFDIFSTALVLIFWASVLCYMPVAIYVFFRNSWKYKKGGLCLSRLYIFYGVTMLVFSVVFGMRWLSERGISTSISEVMISLAIIIFSSIALAYLPVLGYIFWVEVRHRFKENPVHPNVIFVIYCACFLVFSSVYLHGWFEDKKGEARTNSSRNPQIFKVAV